MTPAAPFRLPDEKLLPLALQIAMDISSLDVILREAGLTETVYDNEIKYNPFFQKVLQQYKIEWNSVKNTPDRVKWKAQALIEMGLATLGTRMLDPRENLPAITETAKLVSRIAGVDNDKTSAGSGEKFTITINLGPDNQITYEKTADTKTIDGHAVPAITQGESRDLSVQSQLEQSGSQPSVQLKPARAGADPTE